MREIFFRPKRKNKHQKGENERDLTHSLAESSDFLRGKRSTHGSTDTRERENGRNNGPTHAPRGGQSPVLLESHLQLQRVRLGDRDRLPGGVLPFRNVGRGENDDERGVLEKTDRGDRDDLWGDVWGVFGHGE